MEQPVQEDTIPRGWRVSGLAAAVAGFLLVSLAIHVSTYDVAYGTRSWGSSRLEAGEVAALRIGVRLRQQGAFADAEVSLSLSPVLEADEAPGADPAILLAEGLVSGPTGLVEAMPRLPSDLPPGEYLLGVHVRTGAGPAETAVFPVTVASPETELNDPWAVVRPVCEESSSRRPEGGWHPARRCRPEPQAALLYPAAGHLVAHVAGSVYVWLPPAEAAAALPDGAGDDETRADARPTARPTAIEVVPLRPVAPGTAAAEPAGEPIPVQLDALGLGRFAYTPVFPRGSLHLRADGLDERIWIRDLPGPISLEAPAAIARPGESLEMRLTMPRPGRPIYVDIWTEGRWTHVASTYVRDARGGFTLEVPGDARGLMLVRVAAHPDGSGSATTALWIDPNGATGEALAALAHRLADLPQAPPLARYAGAGPEPEPLIRFVSSLPAQRLASLTPAEAERAAAAMLSRIEPAEPAPPLLGDSTGAKLMALDEWKAGVRRPLMASLVLLAGSVLFGATFLVASYRQRVRARIEALDLDDEATGGDTARDGETTGADDTARGDGTTGGDGTTDGDGTTGDDETARDGDTTGALDTAVPPASTITGGGWASAAMFLLVVAAGVAALMVFLETLRWDRGDVFAARAREAAEERINPR